MISLANVDNVNVIGISNVPENQMLSVDSESPSTDYNNLFNKPQINSVELFGNKQLSDIGVDVLTNEEIEQLINSCI